MLQTLKINNRKKLIANSFYFLLWVLFYSLIGITAKINWHSLTHNFARIYEQMFIFSHYDYLPLYDNDYVWKGTRNHKIFCKKEYFSTEMEKVLETYKDSNLHILQCHRGISTRDFTINGTRFVIKSSRHMGPLKNLLFMGRAVNICNNGIWARDEGIEVLRPIALVENRGWFGGDAAVVYLYEGKTLGNLLASRPELFPKVDALVSKLIEKSVIHHDFHIYNFVVLDDDTVQLIDIDKLHKYPYPSYVFHKRLSREVRKFNKRVVQDTIAPQRLVQV